MPVISQCLQRHWLAHPVQCLSDMKTLTKQMSLVGMTVRSTTCDIAGTIEYVTKDGWAGIRDASGRLDEEKLSRLEQVT